MSLSDAFNNAKAEKSRGGDTPHTQTTPASQPCKTEGGCGDDEDKEVLRIPGSLDFESHSGGAACGTGAVTIDPFGAVGMLGNLWWRMQLSIGYMASYLFRC